MSIGNPNGLDNQARQTLTEIGRRHLAVEDVLARNRRQIERHELATWQLREALEAAWAAGRRHGLGK